MHRLSSFVENRTIAKRVAQNMPKHLADAHRALQAAKKMPPESAGDSIFKAQARVEALAGSSAAAKATLEKRLINKNIKMEGALGLTSRLDFNKHQVGFISGDGPEVAIRAEENMVCLDLIHVMVDDGCRLYKV